MKMLSRKQIAKLFGCSTALIQMWEKEGYMPEATVINGWWRKWPEEQIRKFAEEKKLILREEAI